MDPSPSRPAGDKGRISVSAHSAFVAVLGIAMIVWRKRIAQAEFPPGEIDVSRFENADLWIALVGLAFLTYAAYDLWGGSF